MKEYHKIDSIFKRDEKGKFTTEFSKLEFKYLFKSDWLWTEKIDGTNIRIYFDGEKIIIGGRTDKAEIPTKLLEVLTNIFTVEKLSFVFPTINKENPVILYGEGYGNSIQKVGKYYSDSLKFILFDINIGKYWLQRRDIEDTAEKFNIEVVPIVAICTLDEMTSHIKQKTLKSTISEKEMLAEGVVGYPTCGLKDRTGKRIITKLKHKDFK